MADEKKCPHVVVAADGSKTHFLGEVQMTMTASASAPPAKKKDDDHV